jgi:long-subunit acyl-CoA synthetase (AMP-forming)
MPRGRSTSLLILRNYDAAAWTQIARVHGRLECYEQIRKIALIDRDFPPEVRSVNVFQKIKVDRNTLVERYHSEIDEIYCLLAEGDLA